MSSSVGAAGQQRYTCAVASNDQKISYFSRNVSVELPETEHFWDGLLLLLNSNIVIIIIISNTTHVLLLGWLCLSYLLVCSRPQ